MIHKLGRMQGKQRNKCTCQALMWDADALSRHGHPCMIVEYPSDTHLLTLYFGFSSTTACATSQAHVSCSAPKAKPKAVPYLQEKGITYLDAPAMFAAPLALPCCTLPAVAPVHQLERQLATKHVAGWHQIFLRALSIAELLAVSLVIHAQEVERQLP